MNPKCFAQSLGLVLVVVVIPLGTIRLLARFSTPEMLSVLPSGGSTFAASPLAYERTEISPTLPHQPRITNVQILDFDGDRIADVIACDAQTNRVLWYRQSAPGQWGEEIVLGEDLVDPAHATVVDLDQDGDQDVIVSVLGNIWPDDTHVGRVVLLEQDGGRFKSRVLLDDVRRVADVQSGDLDGDGDVDLAVAVFGYARGQILWLENRGQKRFREHRIHYAPGTIHVPLADYDGDGDLDIAAIVSQEEEEVLVFENLGHGRFQTRTLYSTINFDIGSAGLVQTDLDQDGDPDLLLPVGDNLEDMYSYPQPYHGCLWLENKGNWNFETKRIGTFGGTYAADAGDLDGDGDQDVVLVSMFNDWSKKENASLVWLENDGHQDFRTWQIASDPIHLTTVACGDLNGDGRDDIVAGGLHLMTPLDRLGRVTAWTSSQGSSK